jgi:chromate transporter
MTQAPAESKDSVAAVFWIFLKLGLTSFGGPVAHLGYFREEFVDRRRWLSERSYADVVALCQFLPGPASSQVGMALGLLRQGYRGALAAWAGFTLPSAMALVLFAMSLSSHAADLSPGLLHGLKLVAVAVVAQAVWGMAKVLCVGVPRVTLMTIACCVALWLPSALGQIGVIVMAGLAGLVLFKPDLIQNHDPLPITVSRRAGAVWLALFFLLLMGLPVWAAATSWQVMADINVFFRSGALVFGGGHVVLPLLQEAVVSPGWVSNDAFLAGYGAAQAVPGPLFTFAAFLGASMNTGPTGWLGGLVCLLAIFAPSLFLVAGTVPFWELLRRNRRTQAALMGVNAAVVGLLLAALYQPVWKSAVNTPQDFGMAVMAFVALVYWRLPPWGVVIASGVAGWMAS